MEGRDCIAAAVSRIAMGLARVGYAASWKRGHVESPARMVGTRSTHPLLSPLGKTFQGRGWNASLPVRKEVTDADRTRPYHSRAPLWCWKLRNQNATICPWPKVFQLTLISRAR